VVEAFASHPAAARVQFRLEITDADGHPTGLFVPPRHVRMPSGDLRRHVLHPNANWWTPTSGQAFAADALRRLFPLPEHVLRHGADTYLLPTTAILGDVVSLPEPGGFYRVHGANDSLTSELDLASLRRHIVRARDLHAYIRKVAVGNGLAEYPASVRDVRILTTLNERIVSRRLEPELHPLPGDSLIRIAWQGMRAAATRPDTGPAGRAVHAAWFAAMALAPRRVAHLLATLFMCAPARHRLFRRAKAPRSWRGGAGEAASPR
jgi:hypothetical protein